MIPKRNYRVLTQSEIDTRRRLGMTLDPRVLFREEGLMFPISGASPDDPDNDDDDSDDSDSDDDDSSDDDDDDDEDEKKKKKKASGSADDDDDDDSEDDDEVKLSKNEAARLRRKAKELDDLKSKQEKDKKATERKKKQEEGKWQELLDDEKENTTKEKERADKAEAALSEFKFKTNVAEIAQRLGFKDPTDAFRFLNKEDHIDSEEDVLESALKKVLKNKDYLKSDRKATGGPRGGKDPAGNWDINDIKKMSPDEINKNWDKPGFQDALKNAGT